MKTCCGCGGAALTWQNSTVWIPGVRWFDTSHPETHFLEGLALSTKGFWLAAPRNGEETVGPPDSALFLVGLT